MNIVTATTLIQEQATAAGRSFVDQVIYMSENISTFNDELYKAFVVFHDSMNGYFSYSANKARVQQMARDFDNLDQVTKDRMYNKLPINAKEHFGVK